MHYKTLANVAKIISGHSFRKAIKPDLHGDTYVLQAKDLIQNEPFTLPNMLIKVTYENRADTSFLQKNDIIIVSRGTKFRSTIFLSDSSNIIASSSVHIIRVTSPTIAPEYLSLFLNSPIGQAQIMDAITGNYIAALPLKELGKIEISIPPLSKQHLMVDLHHNLQSQKVIVNQKINIEQAIINNIFGRLNTI